MASNKEIVLKFYDEFFNKWDKSVIDKYIAEDYIQHNPDVATGRAGFYDFAGKFLALEPHMDIKLCAEDGDIVFVFFKCTVKDGTINKVVDIYRLEDGMLAEHWDVVNHNVGGIKSVSGNSLF